jgi:hypothetical protein
MGVVAVVRVMAVMGVVTRCTGGGIPIRQREQRRCGRRVGIPRDGCLCPADAKAYVGDLR